ncbi:hypothetical protein FEM48_ZijujUnG0000500 [Ziziphus jujuba var. spinosa]|uniref:Regulator of rDNA transcription protein 15 n=1 Tax=Ziziphus jujuba var. spinosa TaxID=714518 RepID=A0A978U9B3_ZIZJJ|nr:hypothetical protein FEM48_ZijujUnG0122300 [Ziziphus jujuba var. spinosa]KAH7511144.1 hypothetical protein FEM48_ZijujUnG0041200 [Ziziphus jujuba var. spinosa]KAH7511268.1 hypothetical protein FEM48_ZijujUnG0029300 [Ziziphus jujuba var. spinosa]KAH7511468.1 hypothetical protein FEM48_ZijujUnG0010000 [Ziziphus jujuba var. spinosa]KAH7511470.1 hypothetical protein FEM48_ZijujUnG0010600 [Ziziphus jujuba var. spinosa]
MGMAWGTVGMVWGIGGHGMGHRWASHGARWASHGASVGIAWGIGGHRVHRMGHGGHRMGHGGHRMGHRWAWHGASVGIEESKGSIGHAFTVRIRTGNQNQTSFYPFVPHEISVLVELILGHLRYLLTDVPPQPNSPPDNVFHPDRPAEAGLGSKKRGSAPLPIHGISKITLKVVVFHFRRFRLPLILHLSSHFTKSD